MAVFCPTCGAENRDGANFCASCRSPIGPAQTTKAPGAPPPPPPPPGSSGKVEALEHKLGFPVVSAVIAGICLLYLINPTAGVLELLPDNLPIVGNLDEVAAVAGLTYALAHIGFLEYAGQSFRFHSWQDVKARWRRRGVGAP